MHKTTIRAISLVCGLAMSAIGFAVLGAVDRREMERAAHTEQVRALSDAVTHLEAMSAGLALAIAADEPLPALIALRHDADLAAAALGRVNFSSAGGEALRRFAACTAEISGVLADDLARGTVRAPDYALLVRLRDFALPLTADILPDAISADGSAVDEGALAEHLAGLGRLYYDGAGSDVVPPGGYLSLLSATRYTQSDAYAAAQAAVGRNIRLKATAAEGDPARFCFTSANLTVTVSERGGHLLHLLYDQSGREGNIGRSAALAAAERAIGAHAPEPLVLTGEEDGEGTYYFTFAPQRGDLLCLSERILVGIDASSGRLCLWDADWYYRYRTAQRTYPDNLLSPDLIAARYGGTESPLLCTAVRADGRELLCYRLGEGERAIFLNAVTGKVEQTA